MNFNDFREEIKGIFDGDAEKGEFINNLENLWAMSKIEEIVEAEPNGWYYDREYQAMDEFELNRNEDGKIEIKYSGQVQNDQLNGFLKIAKQTGYLVRFTFRENEMMIKPDDEIDWVRSKMMAKIKNRC